MKPVKILLLVACLLGSAQAIACSVFVTVKNATGKTLNSVSIAGPWSRTSPDYKLVDGQSSDQFHTTGSMFTCHGKYWLYSDSGKPHCDMDATTEDEVYMDKDGTLLLTILKEKNGTACKVSNVRTYNSQSN